MQIATLTHSTIVRIKTFEALLSSLSALIKTSYQLHTPPLSGSPAADKARGFLETKMLFGGSFPQAFKAIIVELFKEDGLLEKVKEEIDPARLFFADFTLLEVDEDAASVKKRKNMGMTVDCFRKDWMVNPSSKSNGEKNGGVESPDGAGKQVQKWKRCSRCASVMEDLVMNRQQLQWLVMQQRRCFCSGYWNTLAPGKTFA
jgi:mediator of RNA polymerase II transcription subunit 16